MGLAFKQPLSPPIIRPNFHLCEQFMQNTTANVEFL